MSLLNKLKPDELNRVIHNLLLKKIRRVEMKSHTFANTMAYVLTSHAQDQHGEPLRHVL